jgi:hypothetical protein
MGSLVGVRGIKKVNSIKGFIDTLPIGKTTEFWVKMGQML